MDLKGITWFGNVYHKFETMCLEVEEAVCQDTVKYLENQVQTVGASVKKFYTEVVDDLVSPSFSDPVKVNSLSCTEVHKKPKIGVKEEPKKQSFEDQNAATKIDKNLTFASSFDRFSISDPAVPCNPVNSGDVLSTNFAAGSKTLGDATKNSELVIKRKPKTVVSGSTGMAKATNIAAIHSSKKPLCSGYLTFQNQEEPADQMFEPHLDSDAVSCNSKEIEGRAGDITQENFNPKQTGDIILPDGAVACRPKESVDGRSFENEDGSKSMHLTEAADKFSDILPSDTSSGPNDIEMYGAQYADADTRNKDMCGFSYFDAEALRIQTEETDCRNIETIISNDDDDDFEEATEIVDMNFSNLLALEESCIIVDREILPYDSHEEQKHKSYKKKFKDAFSSRGKSMRRKKEYRQLAAEYKSMAHIGLDSHSFSSSLHMAAPNLELKKLKSAQLGESEWEIL